jgi:hypothetical protein
MPIVDANAIEWDPDSRKGKGQKDPVGSTFGPDTPTARRVVKAESGGDPEAIHVNKKGSYDSGLFQINSVHIPALKKAGIITSEDDLYDPDTNAKAAKHLHGQKGWQPWDASKTKWDKGTPKAEENNGQIVDASTIQWADEPPQPPDKPKEKPKTTGQRIAGAVAPYVRPVLEAGGAVGGGIVGAGSGLLTGPGAVAASPIGAVVGSGLGYAAGRSAANALDQYAGNRDPVSPTNMLKETGKDVLTGAAMEAGGQIIPQIAKGVGAVVKPVLGKLTGRGTGAIDEAIKSGTSTGMTKHPFESTTLFDKAMRGKITGEEIVENAKGALSALKDQRSTAYQKELASITQNKTVLDITPVKTGLDDLMKQYNVKIIPKYEMKPTGVLNSKGQPIMQKVQVGESIDTSRIAMGKAGRNDIDEIIETVRKWGSKPGDKTPVGLDTLKRQLDDFYSESSQARQFVASIRNRVKDTIVKNVPEYAKMTKGYEEATRLIKDVEAGLMLRKQGMSGRIVADQTLRRLMSSMHDNFVLRRDLVSVLGNKAGIDLMGQVGGYTMRSALPGGLAGTGPAIMGEAALAHLVSPAFWPVLAASSPRLTGEFLRVFAKAMAEMQGTAPSAVKAVTVGLTQPKQQEQEQ